MRVLIFLAVFVSFCCAQAACANAPPACERLARADDVVVEVKDDGVKVVIVNTSDNCTLVFADNLKMAPGREDEPPSLMRIRVEALDGRLLSCVMNGWYVWSGVEPYHFIDFSLTRLPSGRVRVKHFGFDQMLFGIDNYLKAAGHAPLPWGSKVVVRVVLAMSVDEDAAAGRVRDDNKCISVETGPFVHTLPRKPY